MIPRRKKHNQSFDPLNLYIAKILLGDGILLRTKKGGNSHIYTSLIAVV